MKNLTYKLFLFAFISLFISCGSGNVIDQEDDEDIEPTKELVLSVNDNKGTLYFEEVETEFDILDGNGDYTVTSSDESIAKVRIEGTKVFVDFIGYYTSVTITVSDKREQQKSISMLSHADSLIPTGHTLLMEKGTYIDKYINFGAGGYTIELIKGSSAKASVNENDEIIVEGLEYGTSYFKITDKRGTTTTYDVVIIATYDMGSGSIIIPAINDQIISVRISYGENWKIVDYTESLFEGVYMHQATDTYCASLQIDTSKDVSGRGIVNIINDEGQTATITVTVE